MFYGTDGDGVNWICFFCGKMAGGSTTQAAAENARKQGWDRYQHHSYDGERWVCPSCSTRHSVIKPKTKVFGNNLPRSYNA